MARAVPGNAHGMNVNASITPRPRALLLVVTHAVNAASSMHSVAPATARNKLFSKAL